jgi:UMP-CMP kinase
MESRMRKRAETSDRTDDKDDVIKKRIRNYFDQTLPVVDYYRKFGKVSEIDASGSIADVYAQSKRAILP